MNKPDAEALAQFCIDQHDAFAADAWLRRGINDNASTVAAMYLSMTSWYGHEEELERIATCARDAHANGAAFQRAVQSSGLNLVHFSATVRRGIALKRTGAVIAEAKPASRSAAL